MDGANNPSCHGNAALIEENLRGDSAEIPFALSVACDSKRSRSRQPFDFGPAGLRSGRTVSGKAEPCRRTVAHTKKAATFLSRLFASLQAMALTRSSPASPHPA